MTCPLIAISRLGAGSYEWQLVYGNEVVDNDIGDNSITGCLSRAVDCVHEDEKLVEVRYRGIHMGTFNADSVREMPGDIADRITEMYAAYAEAIR